jgi:antirestriction protein ArdC
VFNADQCDGLSLPVLPGLVAGWSSPDTLAALDSLLSGYVDGPRVVHSAQGRAFYSPTLDTVTLPPVGAFASPSGYAGTLLHEITHSTGHASRLDRFKDGGAPARFGDPVYAFEELIAELGAVMLGQVAGVAVDVPQSAAYVGGWLGALRGDRGMIIKAAQAAQRASDRVTGAVLAQVTVEADALATV